MTPSLDEWLQYVESVHPRSIELGLDRVRRVAQRLDVLPPAPLSIIIAGTNGKGSTAVAAEALGMAAGLRVGTTLSPHVHRFNERVRLQGRPMEDEPLARLFDRVDDARGEDSLTYFEYSALVALLAFKQARVDLAVLEVGLGGRLDAFNIVDADIAVVTSIGLDHQDWLGSDLEQIGREKAGVFRSGHPVVVGAVTESVIEAAHNLGCPISRLGSEFEIRESPLKWTWRRPGHADLQIPRCNLAPANCALAATALADRLQLTDTAIAEALSELTLTGRMEHWRIGTVQVIVDVAHNPAGARFLRDQLAQRWPGRRLVALCGMLSDKDAVGVADALGDLVDHWITVHTRGPRAQSAQVLAKRLQGRGTVTAGGDFDAAFEVAVSCAGPKDAILAFGSFSVVEQARTHLETLDSAVLT